MISSCFQLQSESLSDGPELEKLLSREQTPELPDDGNSLFRLTEPQQESYLPNQAHSGILRRDSANE